MFIDNLFATFTYKKHARNDQTRGVFRGEAQEHVAPFGRPRWGTALTFVAWKNMKIDIVLFEYTLNNKKKICYLLSVQS